jgi:hypothetical protein
VRVRVRVRVRARARARVRVRWRAHLLGADALRNHPPALLGLRLLCLLPRARGPLVRVRFRFRFRFRFRVRVRVRLWAGSVPGPSTPPLAPPHCTRAGASPPP